MAVVSWMGIFPLAYIFNHLAAYAAPGTPDWARAAVAAALVVAVMSYWAGPVLTRLFRPWLFPTG